MGPATGAMVGGSVGVSVGGLVGAGESVGTLPTSF